MTGDGIQITEHADGIAAIMTGPVAEFVKALTEKVLQAAVDGAPTDTGELAASLGMELVVTKGKIEGLVGVRAGANERQVGDATNIEVLRFEEYGDGNSPATHFMSQALHAGRA